MLRHIDLDKTHKSLFKTVLNVLLNDDRRLHDRHRRRRLHDHHRLRIHESLHHACRPSCRAFRDENDEIHDHACSCSLCGLRRNVPYQSRPSSCFHLPYDLPRYVLLSYVCPHQQRDVRGDLRISKERFLWLKKLHKLARSFLTLCLPSSCLSS